MQSCISLYIHRIKPIIENYLICKKSHNLNNLVLMIKAEKKSGEVVV